MANGRHITRSEEEILDQAARLVAGTINPEAMGLTPDEVDVELFIRTFKEIVRQMLNYKEALYLAIGTYVNADSSGVYSLDMQDILRGIESRTYIDFHFYHGIALWLCKNDLYAVWLPH